MPPQQNKLATTNLTFTDTSRAGDKYETISTNNGYSKFMKLKIRNITLQDFGSYRCVAKNSLGETDGYIKLDGNPQFSNYIILMSLLHICFINFILISVFCTSGLLNVFFVLLSEQKFLLPPQQLQRNQATRKNIKVKSFG